MPVLAPYGHAISIASTYPREWTPLHTRPKASGRGGPPKMVQEEAQRREWVTIPIRVIIHAQEEDHKGPEDQEEHSPQKEAIQEEIQW